MVGLVSPVSPLGQEDPSQPRQAPCMGSLSRAQVRIGYLSHFALLNPGNMYKFPAHFLIALVPSGIRMWEASCMLSGREKHPHFFPLENYVLKIIYSLISASPASWSRVKLMVQKLQSDTLQDSILEWGILQSLFHSPSWGHPLKLRQKISELPSC